MYNEEVKRKFLEWYYQGHSLQSKHEKWFNDIEEFERKVGKDLSEFDEKEAFECVNSIGLMSSGYARAMLSLFKTYTKWCADYGISSSRESGVAVLKNNKIVLSTGFSSSYFKDEKEFLQTLRLVHEFDNGYPDIPYLIFAWLGLSKEYALSVMESDVDLEDKVIYYPDGSICAMGFSDEIRDVLREFKNCKVATRGTGRGPRTVYKDMSVDVFIKRFEKHGSDKFGVPYTGEQIEAQFRQARAAINRNESVDKLSFKKVRKSGIFNRLYKIELSGVNVTSIENKPMVLPIIDGVMVYYDFLKDYKAFKEAFNL